MKLLYILLMVATLTTGCSQSNLKSIFGPNSASDYPDYIQVGDKFYIQAWELALVNNTPEIIKFGKVERASVISKGTPVYEIPGYPEQDVVAVKTDSNNTGLVTNISGYLIYVQQEENGESHYPEIAGQQFTQIQIFKGRDLLRELKGEDVDAFLRLFNQQGPHNEFQAGDGTIYTVVLIGDQPLGYNYGLREKDGRFGLSHIESKLPDEIADYFTSK